MRATVVGAVLASMFAPAIAWADGDPAAAEVLFREARRAAEAGNYVVACPKFEESYRLDPALGTLLNLADCEENRGQLARAWQHYRQLDEQLPASDERRPIVEARTRALELRAPKLRIVLTAGSANVTRDDVQLGRASLGTSVPVDPGRHVIVVTSPGRRDKRYEVIVGEGDDKEVVVSAGESLVEPKPTSVAIVATPEVIRVTPEVVEGRSHRTTALVLGGVGVAFLATGSAFGIVALSSLAAANADCIGNVCSSQLAVGRFHDAQGFAVAADVTLGIGVVLVGTAIVWAVTGPHARSGHALSMPTWMGGRF